MALTTKTKQQLKAKAHHLKPIVLLGNHGFSDAVKLEIDRALTDHELIKIRVAGEDRDEKRAVIAEICKSLQAEPVQVIGKIAVLFRKSDKPK